MSNKRVHEIAKEQNLSSKEVLEALRAAGIEATAAASTVDEDLALKALAGNGGAAAPAAPAPITMKSAVLVMVCRAGCVRRSYRASLRL